MACVPLTVEFSVGVNLLIFGPRWHGADSLTPLPRITFSTPEPHDARLAEHGRGEHYARTSRTAFRMLPRFTARESRTNESKDPTRCEQAGLPAAREHSRSQSLVDHNGELIGSVCVGLCQFGGEDLSGQARALGWWRGERIQDRRVFDGVARIQDVVPVDDPLARSVGWLTSPKGIRITTGEFR